MLLWSFIGLSFSICCAYQHDKNPLFELIRVYFFQKNQQLFSKKLYKLYAEVYRTQPWCFQMCILP